MSYPRRDKTKTVVNVHLRADPMPKTSTVHRNVDTSVRYTGIGLRSARARPGGRRGRPGGYMRAAREPQAAPSARASRGHRRIPHSCAVRHRGSHGPSMSATPRTLRVLWRLQLPPGVALGSQDT